MRDSTPSLLNQLAKTDVLDLNSQSPALAWENVKGGQIAILTKYFETCFNGNALTAEDILLCGILLQIIANKWPSSKKIERLTIILATQQNVSLADLANLKLTPGREFKSSPFIVLNSTLDLMRKLYASNAEKHSDVCARHDKLGFELIKRKAAIQVKQFIAEQLEDDVAINEDSQFNESKHEAAHPSQTAMVGETKPISDPDKDIEEYENLRIQLIDLELNLKATEYMHEVLSAAFSRLNMELSRVLALLNQKRINPHAKEYVNFLLNYPLKQFLTPEALAYVLCNLIVLAADSGDKDTFERAMQYILVFLKSQERTKHKELVVKQLSQSLSNGQIIEFAKILKDDLAKTKSQLGTEQYAIDVLRLLYRYGFANHNRRHLEAQAKAFMQFISSPRGSVSEEAIASRSGTPSMDSLAGSQSALISAQVLSWMYDDLSQTEEKLLEILASCDFADPATFARMHPDVQLKIKNFILRMTANTLAISSHERQADVVNKHYVRASGLELEKYIRVVTEPDNKTKRLFIQAGNKHNEAISANAFICIRRNEEGMYEVYNPSAPHGRLKFTDEQSTLQFTRAALFGLKKESCGLQALTSYIRSLFPEDAHVLKVTHYSGYSQRQANLHDRAQTPTGGITEKIATNVALVRVHSVPVALADAEMDSLAKSNDIREKVRNRVPVTDLIVHASPCSKPMGSPYLTAYLGTKPRAIPGEGTDPEHVTVEVVTEVPALDLGSCNGNTKKRFG